MYQRAQLPYKYSKTRLCGAQLPHTVSGYQGPAPLMISHKTFFLTFICHIKSNYCFLVSIGYLLYQRAQLPFATKARMLWGPAPPHIQQGRTLWGLAPLHCLRLSGPSSPDNKSTNTFFPNFYLPYKKQLLFLSFHWISVVSKDPAPLCYKSKYVVGPSSPHIQQRKTLWGPAPARCLRLSGPSSPDQTYSKTRLCGVQLPHTVSDYQGPAPLIISHRVQLADLDNRSLITNSQICQLHFLLRMSTCKPHFHTPSDNLT